MLIYLDLETTGLEKNDRICAIGLIGSEWSETVTFEELIKPPRKIRPEAMAIHHITNEMVAGKPLFDASASAAWIKEHNESETILVAHNIGFELAMLEREGLLWQGKLIDTLKCARHLIAEVEHFSLQFLRYELGLYKHEAAEAEALEINISAHSALSDALHVKLLYEYLREMADDDELCALTLKPVLIRKFTFGKYKDHFIEEVAMNDPSYLGWMLENMFDMEEDLRYSVNYYLKEVQ